MPLINSLLPLFLVAQRRGPQHARFWRDGVERFHRCDNRPAFSDGFSR